MRPGGLWGCRCLGELGGRQRQWCRLGVVSFGVPLMAKAMKIVVATVGKLTSTVDAED